MIKDTPDYWRRRADEERAQASFTTGVAAATHRALAEHMEARAATMDEATPAKDDAPLRKLA